MPWSLDKCLFQNLFAKNKKNLKVHQNLVLNIFLMCKNSVDKIWNQLLLGRCSVTFALDFTMEFDIHILLLISSYIFFFFGVNKKKNRKYHCVNLFGSIHVFFLLYACIFLLTLTSLTRIDSNTYEHVHVVFFLHFTFIFIGMMRTYQLFIYTRYITFKI